MNREHRHSLRGLLATQFLGIFNDNAWKIVVALLGIRSVVAEIGPSAPAFETAAQTQTTLAFAVFALPLMLASLPAGVLADRMSKRSVIILMKILEVAFMAAGAVALLHPSGGLPVLLVLGFMGVHSALLSPAKYGILPEILPHDRLSAGNGLFELCNFLAIIAGTYAGGYLLGSVPEAHWIVGAAFTGIAILGFLASCTIPAVPPARSAGGLAATTRGAWAALRADRILRLAVLGSVFFWTLASLIGQQVLVYTKVVLGLPDTVVGGPLAVVAAGTGLGAVLAGKLSASKVEYGLFPLGALVFGFFTLLLGIRWPASIGATVSLASSPCSIPSVIWPLSGWRRTRG